MAEATVRYHVLAGIRNRPSTVEVIPVSLDVLDVLLRLRLVIHRVAVVCQLTRDY